MDGRRSGSQIYWEPIVDSLRRRGCVLDQRRSIIEGDVGIGNPSWGRHMTSCHPGNCHKLACQSDNTRARSIAKPDDSFKKI